MAKITALYADENGEIFFAAGMAGAARLGDDIVRLTESAMTKKENCRHCRGALCLRFCPRAIRVC